MKGSKLSLLLFFLMFPLFLSGQEKSHISSVLSLSQKVKIDTINFYREGLKVSYDSALNVNEISTIEKAIQVFACFTTKELGQKLAGKGYKELNYPSEDIYRLRSSKDYIENFSWKIFYVFYFRHDDRKIAACFLSAYINQKHPDYNEVVFFEQAKGWKLYTDEWSSSLTFLGKFKPQYSTALILGELRGKDELFEELIAIATHDKTLDCDELKRVVESDRKKYSKYLN